MFFGYFYMLLSHNRITVCLQAFVAKNRKKWRKWRKCHSHLEIQFIQAFHKEESKFSSFQRTLTRNNQVWTKNEEPSKDQVCCCQIKSNRSVFYLTERSEEFVTSNRSVITPTDRLVTEVITNRSVRARYRSVGHLVKVLQDVFYLILPDSRPFSLPF